VGHMLERAGYTPEWLLGAAMGPSAGEGAAD